MFTGCMTALVTPMKTGGEIDFACLERLVDRQLAAGMQGLIVNGSTGEAPTLTKAEQQQLLRAVVKQVNKRMPVIAGIGNATQQAIDDSLQALEAGATACLIITPSYSKPTQVGLYAHYEAIAKAVPAPIILYNAPGRAGCDLLPSTIEKLAILPNIVGLKECVFTLPRVEQLIMDSSARLDLLSGNDEETLPAMRLGFKGVISVASNIAPKLMQQMCQAALAGDFVTAGKLNQRLMPLFQALFIESNPIPCKWILHTMGLIPAGIRLPLTPLAEKYHAQLRPLLTDLA